MTLQDVKLLQAFNAWATQRIFDAVEKLTPEQFIMDMKSSHKSIHGTLTHYVAAEKMWLSRFAGKPDAKMFSPADLPTLAEVKAQWEKNGYESAKFLGTMTDKKLQETFNMTNARGETVPVIYWQALQHIVDHSTFHRGQIVSMMRQQGVQPPATGLIGFYREIGKKS